MNYMNYIKYMNYMNYVKHSFFFKFEYYIIIYYTVYQWEAVVVSVKHLLLILLN